MFNLFPFDFKKALLILFVFALPLVSLNFQRAPGEEPWFMKPVNAAAGVAQSVVFSLSDGITDTAELYLNLIGIKRRSQELERDIAQLKVKLAEFTELQIENQRLSQLLDFKSRSLSELVSARVIATDLISGDHSTIRINRGSDHGLRPGQAVITPDGVVGSIFSTEPQTAQVLVLTDRYSVIDAVVQRSRARGLVEGATSTTVRLKYLQRTDDVETGDLVVTTGLDDIYPQGFPVATVISVEKKTYGISQKVMLNPIVDPFRLEEVFVVFKSNNALAAAEAAKQQAHEQALAEAQAKLEAAEQAANQKPKALARQPVKTLTATPKPTVPAPTLPSPTAQPEE